MKSLFVSPVRLLLIAVPLLFLALFTALSLSFDYPGVLRQPADQVLVAFHAGGPLLVALWYGMLATSLLFLALVWAARVADQPTVASRTAAVVGTLAAGVQTLGFARWVFEVPTVAALFADPGASEATRQACLVVFQAFHGYFGQGLGEHLGYLGTALWTALVLPGWLRQHRIGKGLAVAGSILAGGIAVGLVEPLGFAWAGTVNAIAYSVWALWLVIVGVRWGARTRST